MSHDLLVSNHADWKDAKTWKDKVYVVCGFLYNPTTGTISHRCKRSFFLHLGDAGHCVEAATAFLTEGLTQGKFFGGMDGPVLKPHVNKGRAPWNTWPEEQLRAMANHFDIQTVDSPEARRPAPSSPPSGNASARALALACWMHV